MRGQHFQSLAGLELPLDRLVFRCCVRVRVHGIYLDGESPKKAQLEAQITVF
jgi:hypothetical protein